MAFAYRADVAPVGHNDAVDPNSQLSVRDLHTGAGGICRQILDALPHWFGIPESVDDFVAAADRCPSVVASVGGGDVGIVTIVPHGLYAAEVYVMGVLPEFHRNGIGRIMLRRVEHRLGASGVEFLQVKTVSASKHDVGYDKTRAFYLSYGFRPLQEFPTLWDSANPALMMVKAIIPPTRSGRD